MGVCVSVWVGVCVGVCWTACFLHDSRSTDNGDESKRTPRRRGNDAPRPPGFQASRLPGFQASRLYQTALAHARCARRKLETKRFGGKTNASQMHARAQTQICPEPTLDVVLSGTANSSSSGLECNRSLILQRVFRQPFGAALPF